MAENVHQSGTHSPARDEDLARLERSSHSEGHTARSEERYDLAADPQDADAAGAPARGGTPDGMTPADVELRSRIAQVLGPDAFPGDRDRLVTVAAGHHAPDWVIDRLAGLPPVTRFQNVQDLAQALGIGVEARRR